MDLKDKIAQELAEYRIFKSKYEFCPKNICEKNGRQYCDDMPLHDENGKFIGECEKWLNIGYQINNHLSKLLSNLYPYDFEFRGFHLQSLESFFQCLKFKDPNIQKLVFQYKGTDAYHIQGASDYNWKADGNLYWQGKKVNRYSEDYEILVDEAYISLAQNPFYRQALKNVNKPLIHSIGKTSDRETVLTRYEYEREINSLASFFALK